MYIAQSTLDTVRCILIYVLCTFYNIHCTGTEYTLCTVPCTVFSVQCIVNSRSYKNHSIYIQQYTKHISTHGYKEHPMQIVYFQTLNHL